MNMISTISITFPIMLGIYLWIKNQLNVNQRIIWVICVFALIYDILMLIYSRSSGNNIWMITIFTFVEISLISYLVLQWQGVRNKRIILYIMPIIIFLLCVYYAEVSSGSFEQAVMYFRSIALIFIGAIGIIAFLNLSAGGDTRFWEGYKLIGFIGLIFYGVSGSFIFAVISLSQIEDSRELSILFFYFYFVLNIVYYLLLTKSLWVGKLEANSNKSQPLLNR